ncbi:MAG: hypothetical protein ABSD89_11400 [Halobacteriota archaeon]|jgi:hypothetical protein
MFDFVTSHLYEKSFVSTLRAHNVKPCDADFRADCGLAAKRSLSPFEYELWRNTYLDFLVPEDRIPVAIRMHIKQRVGSAYIRRGLTKLGTYFKEKTSCH